MWGLPKSHNLMTTDHQGITGSIGIIPIFSLFAYYINCKVKIGLIDWYTCIKSVELPKSL